jgi:hypothetical protein
MAWQMSPNTRRNVLAGRTMPPAAVAKPRMMKKKTVLGGATSRGAPVSTLSAYVAESTPRRPRSTSTGVGVAAVRCSPSRIGQREAVVAPRLRIPSRTYEPHLARTLIASTPSTHAILTNSILAQRSSTSFPPRKQRRRARHVYLLGDRPGRPRNSHKVRHMPGRSLVGRFSLLGSRLLCSRVPSIFQPRILCFSEPASAEGSRSNAAG